MVLRTKRKIEGVKKHMKDYMKIYEQWLADPYFDEDTKNELRAIADDENEIKERFYMDLEFGTAGLRGIIGAGINRMNIYTVRRATQGLANYIKKQGGEEKGVAIAFDSRRMSPEFAMEAAMTLAANGIKAYKFESLRPTPELSFAVRELGCIAGINITASHNPPEYNGYKVYWEDGAQFTPPHDKGVLEEVLAIEDLSTVKTTSEEAALRSGKFQVIGKEIDDKYIENVKAQVVNQDAIDRMQKDITIIYTPLHGTGNIPARRVMKELGFENVYVVPEQELPDGNFPTVSYPNPEAEEAFALGLKLAKEKNADLVLATDPDADRLGVYVKDAKTGEYHPLTGNMSGSLLCDYVLGQKQAKGLEKQAEAEENKTSEFTYAAVDPEREYGFVAVAAGEGLKAVFGDLGVDAVVSGGQTMNPSTEDILAAVQSVPAKTVLVLPNNKNIIMASEQAQKLADRKVIVLPTRTVPQGMTAMLNFDPDLKPEENAVAMMQAADHVSTGLITYAARDSEFDGKPIKKGEIMALENGKIVSTGTDIVKMTYRLARSMKKKDSQFITVISGCDVSDEDAEKTTEMVRTKCGSSVEVSHISGGQPVYYYMISVE